MAVKTCNCVGSSLLTQLKTKVVEKHRKTYSILIWQSQHITLNWIQVFNQLGYICDQIPGRATAPFFYAPTTSALTIFTQLTWQKGHQHKYLKIQSMRAVNRRSHQDSWKIWLNLYNTRRLGKKNFWTTPRKKAIPEITRLALVMIRYTHICIQICEISIQNYSSCSDHRH